jgi:predicted hydrocarbon binding protein
MRWVFAENQGKNYGKNIKFNNFKMISKLLCGGKARVSAIAYVENLFVKVYLCQSACTYA